MNRNWWSPVEQTALTEAVEQLEFLSKDLVILPIDVFSTACVIKPSNIWSEGLYSLTTNRLLTQASKFHLLWNRIDLFASTWDDQMINCTGGISYPKSSRPSIWKKPNSVYTSVHKTGCKHNRKVQPIGSQMPVHICCFEELAIFNFFSKWFPQQ